jgi:hypothetical protein
MEQHWNEIGNAKFNGEYDWWGGVRRFKFKRSR